MAPEVFEDKPYTSKADVYSFGIVLWEICNRVTPYAGMGSVHAIMKYVTDGRRPSLDDIPSECPKKVTFSFNQS